jgi:hypothetical protein
MGNEHMCNETLCLNNFIKMAVNVLKFMPV